MNTVKLTDGRTALSTVLSDRFIKETMPAANGEFVKIYIYLLSAIHHPEWNISLSAIADVFTCTETDVLRALRYWESAGILVLGIDRDTITSIAFSDPERTENGPIPASGDLSKIHRTSADTPGKEENHSYDPAEKVPAAPAGEPISCSPDRIRELQENNEDVRQLLFVTEQYLGRTLNRTDISCILYFYDTLHMSTDLIEYLIEYCVLRSKKSIHYIEKVGLEWHKNGIRTVKEAKEQNSPLRKEYYTVLKAFGIRDRGPVPAETEAIDRWMNTYGFDLDLILEAVNRTVTKTGSSSFPYAESILASWHKQNIYSLADVSAEDERYQASRKKNTGGENGKQKTSSPNRFHNFHQRDYDYDQLEKDLLKSQW